MASLQPGAVTAELTILGAQAVVQNVGIAAVEAERVVLSNAPLLPLGALIRLREGQRLWLGEVTECHPGASAVIRVAHYLDGVDELSELADRFLGKRSSESASVETVTLS
jgi:hypothetical protein